MGDFSAICMVGLALLYIYTRLSIFLSSTQLWPYALGFQLA